MHIYKQVVSLFIYTAFIYIYIFIIYIHSGFPDGTVSLPIVRRPPLTREHHQFAHSMFCCHWQLLTGLSSEKARIPGKFAIVEESYLHLHHHHHHHHHHSQVDKISDCTSIASWCLLLPAVLDPTASSFSTHRIQGFGAFLFFAWNWQHIMAISIAIITIIIIIIIFFFFILGFRV